MGSHPHFGYGGPQAAQYPQSASFQPQPPYTMAGHSSLPSLTLPPMQSSQHHQPNTFAQGRYPQQQFFPQDLQQQHQTAMYNQSAGGNPPTMSQQYGVGQQPQMMSQQSSLFGGQSAGFPPLTHANQQPTRPAMANNFLTNSTDPTWGSTLTRPSNISNADILNGLDSIIEPSADPFANRGLGDNLAHQGTNPYYTQPQHHPYQPPSSSPSLTHARNPAVPVNHHNPYNLPRVSPQSYHQQMPHLAPNFGQGAFGGDPYSAAFHARGMPPQQMRPPNPTFNSMIADINTPSPSTVPLATPAATPTQPTPPEEKVKRPVNSYFLFSQTRGKELRRMDPTMTTATVSRLLSEEWKRLDPVEKDRYIQRAKEMKAEFVKEHPEYVWGRVKGDKKKDDGSKKRKAQDESDDGESDGSESDGGHVDAKAKKPMNAFLVFNQEMRPQLQHQLQLQAGAGQKPSFTVSDISRLIGDQWRGLGPDEKAKYVAKSKVLKEEYEQKKNAKGKKKKRKSEGESGEGKKGKSRGDGGSGSNSKVAKPAPYPSPEERLSGLGANDAGLFEGLIGYPDPYGPPPLHHPLHHTGLPSPISPAGSPPSKSGKSRHASKSSPPPSTSSNSKPEKDKKKKKKDKDAIKKPTGPFLYYLAEVRPAYTARFPGCRVGIISQKISAAWRELRTEERKVYVERAKMDKIRYMREK
ncbi:hypothetical protein HK097_008923, partial [Rhizophlyctis rosea]